MGVNAFIVETDAGLVLIDSGLPRRHSRIVDALKAIDRSPADIVAILLTHAHADHTGGAAALTRSSEARVLAPVLDAPAIAGQTSVPPPPILDRPWLRWLVRFVPSAEPVPAPEIGAPGPVPDLPGLTAIPTPGHTPGHMSYLLESHDGILFVGDAAMCSRRGRVHRGYMNRATSTLDSSLRTMASQSFEIACFGHSPPLVGGAASAFRRCVEAW